MAIVSTFSTHPTLLIRATSHAIQQLDECVAGVNLAVGPVSAYYYDELFCLWYNHPSYLELFD